MPIDLILILKTISGLSSLAITTNNLIYEIKGKKSKDEDRKTETINNIKEMTKGLEGIRDCGLSLSVYHLLYAATDNLHRQGNPLYHGLRPTLAQSSSDATIFTPESIEIYYNGLKSTFTRELSNFRDEHIDNADQETVNSRIDRLRESFGGVDTLLKQTQLDHVSLRNCIREIMDASDELNGIADKKIKDITVALSALTK